MNTTYPDSQSTTAAADGTAESPSISLVSAYRLLLDGRGVLTMLVGENGSPISVTVDPDLDITDAATFRELALMIRSCGSALVVYDLDCTEPMTRILGIPYKGKPENRPALTGPAPLFIGGTVTRPVTSEEVMSDAA